MERGSGGFDADHVAGADAGRAAAPVTPATDRQALAVALLVAWITGAIYLVAGADTFGLLENDVWTPWHAPVYLGIAAVVLYLLALARRAVSQRHPRGLVPPEFTVSALGAVLLVLYLPLDVVWSALAGTPADFERLTAIPRLWFSVGLIALASGPIVVGLRRPIRPTWTAALAVVLASGAAGATISFTSGSFSPIVVHAGLRQALDPVPGADATPEVHRLTIDGLSNVVLGRGADLREPSASPDGSQLAVVRWRQGGDDRAEADVELMTTNLKGRHTVTDDGEWKGQISWSPDGTRLAYMATTFGAHATQPTTAPAPVGAPDPGVEPAPLIFSGPGGDWDIVTLDLASGETTTLVSGPGQEGRPAWSPDGTRIAFYSTRAGSLDLWLVDVASGELTRLTDDPAADWGASWSPDGSTIVFNSDREGEHRIFAANVATGDVQRLSDGPNEDWGPAVSPDGKWIVFTSDRTGKTELWLMPASGGDAQRLTNTFDRYPEMTAGGWSPDSQSIIYASRELFQGEGPTPDDRLAFASFALAGAILGIVIGLIFAAGSWFPMAGTVVVLIALGPLAIANDELRWLPAALIAGLAVDVAAWLTRRRSNGTARIAGLAGLGAIAWAIAFFVSADQTGELAWEFNLLASAVGVAALIAGAAAAALAGGRFRSESA